MAEKKECIHCHRSIDVVARVCPYCNRDQDAPRTEVRSAVPLPPIESPPVPRATTAAQAKRREWSTRALFFAAVVALLTASFAVGGLVYGLGKRGNLGTSEQKEEDRPLSADRIQRSKEFPQLTLVEDSDPATPASQLITSAPIPDADQQTPQEFQRTDATALPSTEYAKIVEQQRKQAAAATQIASADPRAVTAQQPTAVYAQPRPQPAPPPAPTLADQVRPARPSRPEPEVPRNVERTEPDRFEPRPQRSASRTNPVPLYQPLPRVDDEVQEGGTLRFRLSVGRDGRVDEIRVLETMPGMTGKMIAAIQKWKFKPATENGIPVDGTFMVDISFNAR